MIYARAVVAFGLLWLLGFLWLSLAGIRSRSGAGRWVLDTAAGASALACLGMYAIAAGARISASAVYVLLGVLAAVHLWRVRRGSRARPPRVPRGPLHGAELVVIMLTAGLLSAIAIASMSDALWWDGWAIWTLKARVLFLEGTLPRGFLDPYGSYAFTHLDYPLGVPLVDWWLFHHAGKVAPAVASFAGAIWFIMLPVLGWSALRDRIDTRAAAGVALGLAAFWPVAFYAVGGTADVVIAVALLGGVAELVRALDNPDESTGFWRAAIFFSLGALAKNEGLALALVALVVVSAALLHSGERRWRAYLPLLVPLLLLAPWLVFTRTLGLGPDNLSSALALPAVLERIPTLFTGWMYLFSSGPWLPVPALVLVGALAAARAPTGGLAAGWGVFGGYFAVLCAVYLQAPQDLVWLLVTSQARVFGALIPAAVYLAALSALRGHVSLPDVGSGRAPHGAVSALFNTRSGGAL